MAQTSGTALESDTALASDQDAPMLDALAPSAHPPITLPRGSFLTDTMNPPVLGFAPAPTVPAGRPSPAAAPEDRPAPLTRPQGRFHIGWYEAAVIALLLGCAAVCAYRLLWAIQI